MAGRASVVGAVRARARVGVGVRGSWAPREQRADAASSDRAAGDVTNVTSSKKSAMRHNGSAAMSY